MSLKSIDHTVIDADAARETNSSRDPAIFFIANEGTRHSFTI